MNYPAERLLRCGPRLAAIIGLTPASLSATTAAVLGGPLPAWTLYTQIALLPLVTYYLIRYLQAPAPMPTAEATAPVQTSPPANEPPPVAAPRTSGRIVNLGTGYRQPPPGPGACA